MTYDLSAPDVVTITLPAGSDWTSGLHWHETHTEFLQIIKGRAEVTFGGRTRNITPGDGIIRVERFAKHEWKRAKPRAREALEDRGDLRQAGDADEELVVKEWTDAEDGMKEIFFRNLNSVITEPMNEDLWLPDLWITLQLFMIFHGLDNYPVLLGGVAGHLMTHVVLRAARILGLILGLKPAYPEYTPKRLLDKYEESRKSL